MRPIPVPPPVITATKPFTPNKEAASREDISMEVARVDTVAFVGNWGETSFIYMLTISKWGS